MLVEYLKKIHGSGITYEKRGKYIDAVLFFLYNAESVNKRGYNKFCKQHAEYLVTYPFAKEGILHFLGSRGVGFRNVTAKKIRASELILTSIDQRRREIINGFILWLKDNKDYSASTLQVYTNGIKQYFSYFDQFNQENCRQYISHLESTGTNPKTICLRITALIHLGEYLRKPIILKRPTLKRTLHTDNVPTEQEYRMICDYLSKNNPDWLMVVKLMATTGCRFSELAQFTYEQVVSGSCLLKGKGGKYRQFFFNKEMQQMARIGTGRILNVSDRGLNERLKRIGDKLGIAKEKMHPHAFRHFFAKMYLKKTKDVVGLAELLGHGSVDTTRIYLQKSYDEQKREIDRAVTW